MTTETNDTLPGPKLAADRIRIATLQAAANQVANIAVTARHSDSVSDGERTAFANGVHASRIMLVEQIKAIEATYPLGILPKPSTSEPSVGDTPPGWKLVPVVPTEAMMAACLRYARVEIDVPSMIWAAMLAASPDASRPPSAEQGEIAGVIKKLERASEAMMDGRLPRFGQLLVAEEAMSDAVAILSLLRGDTANGGEG